MKQIALKYRADDVGEACLGRVVFIWGLYGYGVWWLSAIAGPSPWGQFATWAIALAVAGLLLASGEL